MRSTPLRLSTPSSAPPPPSSSIPKSSGPSASALEVLKYTGIPTSWIRKPKLPGRNWLIFYGVVGSLSAVYWYDRKECRIIKEEYIAKVKHLSEVPLGSMELPRKVDVYACKWPGDEEYDASMKFFKRYVKPLLVAAAIDYAPKNGNQYGGIADLIKDRAQEQRRRELGIFPPATPWKPAQSEESRKAEHERWMQGGTILIGRHTFKEYMHGLKRGWTETLVKVDNDDALANRLADDGVFDEVELPSASDLLADEPSPSDPVTSTPSPIPTPSQSTSTPSNPPSSLFAPLGGMGKPSVARPSPSSSNPNSTQPTVPEYLTQTPATISPQPPLLLVTYPTRLGFFNIPWIIADWFNERKNVKIGCEAAYKLIMNETREFVPPPSTSPTSTTSFVPDSDTTPSPTEEESSSSSSLAPGCETGGDLDFAASTESTFGRSFTSLTASIKSSRETYYKDLVSSLKLARELARGDREPTKDEISYPPKTEVDLREERFKKERRWRADEEAYEVLKKGSGVAWDERFREALRVFETPKESIELDLGESTKDV